MLGDFDLGFAKNFLEMADAQGRPCQQVQNAESRPVTEAFVDLDEIASH